MVGPEDYDDTPYRLMRIMVLADGETYTTAEGSLLLEVPDYFDDEVISSVAKYFQNHLNRNDTVPGSARVIARF